MSLFLEAESWTLPRHGEEVCGDTIRMVRTPERFLGILSDGLGNGIRASLASTLIVEILSRMLSARLPLEECLSAITATLPLQLPSNEAYATFLVIDIDRETGDVVITNCGNPPVLRFARTTPVHEVGEKLRIGEQEITQQRFTLAPEGLLVAMSDGIVGAGPGVHYNTGWDVAALEKRLTGTLILQKADAKTIVRDLAGETVRMYRDQPGDDCSLLVVRARRGRTVTLFTGPPLDPATDDQHAAFFMNQPGKKIICGGTTASIVAMYLGSPARPIPHSEHDDLPPVSRIEGVDLTTEGILTLLRLTEYLVQSGADGSRLPETVSGAAMIAQELLAADSVLFMIGQAENAGYASLHLPSSSLLRKSAVRQITDVLQRKGKEVRTVVC
jgi:hypothetical protein